MSDLADLVTQRAYYDNRWRSEGYSNLLQLHRTIAILDALRRIGLREPRMLDLGCGTGWLTTILKRFGPATGIDLSPVAIEKARSFYPDVDFLSGDLTTLAEPPSAFDIVVSQEVIEHLDDQPGYLELVARLLRPGGYLILTTPNAWNLAHWTRDAIVNWGLQPIENWLTRGELRKLLEREFRVLELRTIILGCGTQGVFRLANSPQLSSIIRALRLSWPVECLLERTGFGLHIIATAQRR